MNLQLLFLVSSFETVVSLNCSVDRRAGEALARARRLEAPTVELTSKGEFEGADFWEEHEDLLKRAWDEAPKGEPLLYHFNDAFEHRYIRPELREAADAARRGEGEMKAWRLFREVSGVSAVYASDAFFTKEFLADMRAELDRIETLGIPTRRPNGMNRYGAILDDVGFEAMFTGLVDHYIRPLAAMLFPELVTSGDAAEHYAFSVRYSPSEDTELAKHRDASVVTINLCLGDIFQGGDLRFFGDGPGRQMASSSFSSEERSADDKQLDVQFEAGMLLMHKGQHQHQALPLTSGLRTNIIMWLFAKDGVVRVAPYKESDRLSPDQRWAQHHSEL